MWIFYIHPILQATAFLFALYALYLGFQKFRLLHLNHKVTFNWKRHVILGQIALEEWIIGMIIGASLVRYSWYGWFITGLHAKIALTMLPLILFGLISGVYMNLKQTKRKVLPLVHGINNTIVLILAFCQFFIGWQVFKVYVLGE